MFLIIGGGLAGLTAARILRSMDGAAEITLLEAEPSPYYLRPGLIDVLSGRKTLAEITPLPAAWFEGRGIVYRTDTTVVALHAGGRRVDLSTGETMSYRRLLVSSGAEAALPPIPGAELGGVFTLRSAADAERIRTRAGEVRSAAVIGGGWLGIEVVRALHDLGLTVTLLERGPWLLCRQLDGGAGGVLGGVLASQEIDVRADAVCAAIEGTHEAEAVRLTSGDRVSAGLVVISAGIRPRVALAAEAGLATNQGVVVDDHLATSAPDVWAAGDVAEWRGQVYGIIPAAREQGAAAARNMVEPGSAPYAGTTPSNRLKVAGVDLLCLGDTQPRGGALRELRDVDPTGGRYAKFVLGAGGELAGAILLGHAELAGPVEELARAGAPAEGDLRTLLGSLR